jgi:hypothetical protein
MIFIIIVLIIIILALGALAFWLWKLYRREYDRRWDETSISLNWEKSNVGGNELLDQQDAFIWELINKIEQQQDRLSEIICPTNNHVWIDGKCSKCGRVKND